MVHFFGYNNLKRLLQKVKVVIQDCTSIEPVKMWSRDPRAFGVMNVHGSLGARRCFRYILVGLSKEEMKYNIRTILYIVSLGK